MINSRILFNSRGANNNRAAVMEPVVQHAAEHVVGDLQHSCSVWVETGTARFGSHFTPRNKVCGGKETGEGGRPYESRIDLCLRAAGPHKSCLLSMYVHTKSHTCKKKNPLVETTPWTTEDVCSMGTCDLVLTFRSSRTNCM